MKLVDVVEMVGVDQFGLPVVTPATARWMRLGVGRLAAHSGVELVDELRPADVASWVEHERAGKQAVTVNSYLRAVKTVFARLERAGLVGVNPARPVAFLKEPPGGPKAIAKDDYMAMRAAAGCARDRAILDVLWASGCRLGGLLSMRIDRMNHWQASDGRRCYAFYVVEKFDRPRWVYVGRERREGEGVTEYLNERPAVGERALFLAENLPIRPIAGSTVESVIRRCRDGAGIPAGRPANVHAFRHAFALRMLNDGEDLAAVSAWLGHATPEFTARVYAVRSEDELRRKYFRDMGGEGGQ